VYDLHGVMMQLATDPTLGQTPAEIYQTTLERRRMAEELRMAADIQRLLLPHGNHCGDGFEVAAISIPCRAIGGDFFDYLELPDGSFGFALADVSGKGPPAALLAAEVQGVLAAYSQTAGTVAESIQCVNQVLVRRTLESRFVTLVYAVLSQDGRLTYCGGSQSASPCGRAGGSSPRKRRPDCGRLPRHGVSAGHGSAKR
jgi:sigma-B regulation protein RsbU (phosphoserine phosphatase)